MRRCIWFKVPVNQKSGEASVTIIVTSTDNDRPPRFQLDLYRTEITENFSNGSTVINTNAIDPDRDGQVRRSTNKNGLDPSYLV